MLCQHRQAGGGFLLKAKVNHAVLLLQLYLVKRLFNGNCPRPEVAFHLVFKLEALVELGFQALSPSLCPGVCKSTLNETPNLANQPTLWKELFEFCQIEGCVGFSSDHFGVLTV